MNLRKIALTPIVLGALAGAFSGCHTDPQAQEREGQGQQVKRVRVAAVESIRSVRDLQFSGVVRAARRGRLAFTLGGRLASRPVEVGDRVREGQVLASLDELRLANAVRSAEGDLEELEERLAQARRELERSRLLVEAEAATTEEVERSASAVEALEASLATSRANLAEERRRLRETRLVAPFAGVVTEVLPEPGEYVTAGSTVVVLAGEGELEVEVEVPETLLSRLARGSVVDVELPALGRRAPGLVHSLGLTALGPGRLFPVTVRFRAEGARAGMTAEVLLDLESEAALAVPVEAVVDPGGREPAVFRVEGEAVRRLPVRIGALTGERVVVEGPLAAGDRVVVGGQRGLLDGERVEVLP